MFRKYRKYSEQNLSNILLIIFVRIRWQTPASSQCVGNLLTHRCQHVILGPNPYLTKTNLVYFVIFMTHLDRS